MQEIAFWRSVRRAKKVMALADFYIKLPYAFYGLNETAAHL